jgi:nanoRNase/pAp phosphatase (c-di-AMP/oligoRNAs hydrolase)
VNCNHYFASDVGHVLAKDHPFSASYYDTNDGRVFSLRSAEGCIDVSVVAKHLGGGGHASAAGFRVTFDEARAFEIAP